jgi:hypothetical protein
VGVHLVQCPDALDAGGHRSLVPRSAARAPNTAWR